MIETCHDISFKEKNKLFFLELTTTKRETENLVGLILDFGDSLECSWEFFSKTFIGLFRDCQF